MSRCDFCKRKAYMPNTCKFCEKQLCIKCLLPPKHECKNIDKWRSKDGLRDQLMTYKCVGEKIDKI